jgi:lipoprotein-releasing system permease protein
VEASRFISRKLSFQGKLAAVAIAVSFFVMIVAVAVSSGFRAAVRDGVAAMVGDIRIQPQDRSLGEMASMPRNLPSQEAILSLPGVKGIRPAVLRSGVVKDGDRIHGVLVKGIQRPDSTLSVSIPERLSRIMGLGVGDNLTTYFIGERVRVRKFRITAVHRDLVEMDDNLVVYANLEDLQRLNGWEADEVSCLEVEVADRFRDRAALDNVAAQLGVCLLNSGTKEEDNLYVTASPRAYPQVFDWLELLDFNVFTILILMTVVAGFNMISGLLILLLRNISTIGTLKTMGMDNKAVGGVFVRVGAGVVLKGLLIGNALALLFCLVQGATHLIPLDPANYFVSYVPVHVNLPWILAADVLAFLAILAMLWLPARYVSKIDPAVTVKAD